MKPTTPSTDPKFVYVKSINTNIRERFDRIRAEQKHKIIVDNVLAVSVAAWERK